MNDRICVAIKLSAFVSVLYLFITAAAAYTIVYGIGLAYNNDLNSAGVREVTSINRIGVIAGIFYIFGMSLEFMTIGLLSCARKDSERRRDHLNQAECIVIVNACLAVMAEIIYIVFIGIAFASPIDSKNIAILSITTPGETAFGITGGLITYHVIIITLLVYTVIIIRNEKYKSPYVLLASDI
jgi:hypothetical protein